MPRDRIFQPPVPLVLTSSGFIASASRKDLRSARRKTAKIQKEGWQPRCWYFYDTIGEYAYAMNWVGNLLSRAKLIVTKNGKPVSSGAAFDALQALFGGPLAQAEMLRQLGVHLSVAGEAYLVGESHGEDPDSWAVVSNLRITQQGTAFKLTGREEPLENALVLRLWRPHPVDEKQATSASRAILPILNELEGLTKGVAADIDSRLIGAGLLLMPNEVSFPSLPVITEGEGTSQTRTGVDGIQDMLIQAASIAISDQESAQAKVPLVMQMPGERIAEVRHITFWSDFDAETKELRKEAITRIALGLDMPPEALTGTGDMNHWNAWQLEEAAIKIHTEPMLQLITSGLTEKYLWEVLESDGMSEEEARQYAIGYDITELRLRPNRSKEAQELYDRGALNLAAMLRENGFDPSDKMEGQELKDWFLRKVASGSTTPELVAEALRALEVPIAMPAVEAPTTEAPQPPTHREHPTRELPNDGVPPELVAAGEVLVYRALERAGNRLKSKMRGVSISGDIPTANLYQHVPFKADDIDDLLTDAWGACELFSMGFCQDKLDEYARVLLATRQPHNRELLASYLGPQVVAA